tara:strand:+ start:1194 stop:1403 length:210 start_codon:yes stop_codon:yes gene_type:complete
MTKMPNADVRAFHFLRDVCWVCGGQLIWGGDHELDKEDNPEYYILTNLTCSSCESFVEVYHKRPEYESK